MYKGTDRFTSRQASFTSQHHLSKPVVSCSELHVLRLKGAGPSTLLCLSVPLLRFLLVLVPQNGVLSSCFVDRHNLIRRFDSNLKGASPSTLYMLNRDLRAHANAVYAKDAV
jgi:hypothetical protein